MVANGVGNSQEVYDVLGHQRGWEILLHGVSDPVMSFPPFADFALAIARDAVELSAAPSLTTSEGEVTVVTDPHYNTLVSHEIIGHPVELDRGLKMETAYAGRSWLLRGLDDNQVGQADRLAARHRLLGSRPPRLRPLRLRPRRARRPSA